jgi:hypothetical protein
LGLPRLGENGRLRLDRQLDAERDAYPSVKTLHAVLPSAFPGMA